MWGLGAGAGGGGVVHEGGGWSIQVSPDRILPHLRRFSKPDQGERAVGAAQLVRAEHGPC